MLDFILNSGQLYTLVLFAALKTTLIKTTLIKTTLIKTKKTFHAGFHECFLCYDSEMSESVSLGPAIVTGGCGFTGSHMVEGILSKAPGCEVHVITRNVRNQIPGVTYHACDIASLKEVQAVFDNVRPKTVFHVACPDISVSEPSVLWKINVGGSRNLLQAAKNTKTVHAFVYTSSSSVIHNDRTGAVDLDDSMPVLGREAQTLPYSLTKGVAETEILAASRSDGDASMLTVSIRPPAIFGERDDSCAGKIIANARQGRAHYQFGSGKNLTDVVYITNLIDAHILAAEALVRAYGKAPLAPEKRVDGESFLVLNEKPVPFWEFQRRLAASAGYPVKPEEVVVIPIWLAYCMAAISEWITWAFTLGKTTPIISRYVVRASTIPRTFNGEKARRVLGYRPKVDVEEAVARTGRWYREEEMKQAEAKKVR